MFTKIAPMRHSTMIPTHIEKFLTLHKKVIAGAQWMAQKADQVRDKDRQDYARIAAAHDSLMAAFHPKEREIALHMADVDEKGPLHDCGGECPYGIEIGLKNVTKTKQAASAA